MTNAQLLAEVICRCPLEADDRIAVLAQYTKVVGDEAATELIHLLPRKGCEIADVEEILRDDQYPGLRTWCQWIFARTGNRWLDTTRYQGGTTVWSRENVDELARHWRQYLELDKQMKSFNSWLGHDFAGRSAEVIRYMASRVGKPLIEVFGGEDGNQNEERLALTV
jgi:hypothetical protein